MFNSGGVLLKRKSVGIVVQKGQRPDWLLNGQASGAGQVGDRARLGRGQPRDQRPQGPADLWRELDGSDWAGTEGTVDASLNPKTKPARGAGGGLVPAPRQTRGEC